jgi:hypothetical protein
VKLAVAFLLLAAVVAVAILWPLTQRTPPPKPPPQ